MMFGPSSSLMRRHNATADTSTNDDRNGNDVNNETVQVETVLNEYTRACQVYGCQ